MTGMYFKVQAYTPAGVVQRVCHAAKARSFMSTLIGNHGGLSRVRATAIGRR